MELRFRAHLGWVLVSALLVTGLLLGLQASAVGDGRRGAGPAILNVTRPDRFLGNNGWAHPHLGTTQMHALADLAQTCQVFAPNLELLGAGPGSVTEQQSQIIAAPAGLEASEQFSQTIYLPVVYQAFGAYRPLSFGIQLYRVNSTSTGIIEESGAGWVRMPLSWVAIEPVDTTPQHYRWDAGLEAELVAYAGKGVRVILTLTSNPPWAADFPGGPVHEADADELVEFLQAVVARYGAAPYNVKHWEMYNEPDNGDLGYASVGWGYFGDDPQAYVDLLEAVYQPIKDVDPEAQVLFGGIAYDRWEPDGPFVESFLDLVLGEMQANGRYPFDMMNFHYYPIFRANWEAYGTDIIGKANFIRAKLLSYGAGKPLICTEAGLWSDCRDPDDEVICSSYEEQGRYVPQLYARGDAADLEINVWFMLVDSENPYDLKHGLLETNLEFKRSYTAYQVLAEQLASAEYVRTLGLNETGSEQIEAYEFREKEGSERIIVAWSNDDANHTMALAGSCLTSTDKYGVEGAPVCDGDDGRGDGVIQVSIGPSPVYLRLP